MLDSLDKCPNTDPQSTVDSAGCPILDDDNDGVPNNLDQCQNTEAGVPVDERGCVLDSDNDGIHDNADQCANTPAGAKVDETGCRIILEEVVSMTLKVTFPSNSAEIRDQYLPEIEKLADFMRLYPDTTVVVEGHSDSSGNADYNQQLSERRAKSGERCRSGAIPGRRITNQQHWLR